MNNEWKTKQTLKFREDGGFRILTVSDIHGGVGFAAEKTVRALTALVEETKPDLVLFLGDTAGPGIIHIETEAELRTMLDVLSAPMENAGIPWAHVFGNHDDNYGLPNNVQQTVYESYPHCISKAGPDEISGVGNYVLPVLDAAEERILFNVFGLDSHSGMNEFCRDFGLPSETRFFQPSSLSQSGYDTVHFDQIAWYWETSRAMEAYNGAKIPALMVMHIPLPEHALITMHRDDCNFDGTQLEDVACTPLNSGLFSACLQRGDVRAICCGHDHVNDFCGEYCGITLAYDGFLSYHACHKNYIRGGRVFDLSASDPSVIRTHMVRVHDLLGDEGNS